MQSESLTGPFFSSDLISAANDCHSILAGQIVLSDAGSRSSAPFLGRVDGDFALPLPRQVGPLAALSYGSGAQDF